MRGSQGGHGQAMEATGIQPISTLQTCVVAQKTCYAAQYRFHEPHSSPAQNRRDDDDDGRVESVRGMHKCSKI